MKTTFIALSLIFLGFVSCPAIADRQLERTELLRVFEELTSQPRKTWIAAGSIEAIHEQYSAPKTTDANEIDERIREKIQEYQADPNKPEGTESLRKMRLDAVPFNVRSKLANELTMSSTVLVRFDGERFYWEINVNSRRDSMEPGKELFGNFMTRHFDLSWNARRIFAWDGERYTTYSASAKHATVDLIGATPHFVNGPLTAGIVPWGYGYCTYEKLAAAESSAVETLVNGQTQINLVVIHSDGVEMTFALDPEKDYAVISSSVTGLGSIIHSGQFSGYQLVSGKWAPSTILAERYDAATNRLLSSDLWTFTNISADVPTGDSFNVEFGADTSVEYLSPATDGPLIYHSSELLDSDLLLGERLAVAASEGIKPQNCATTAMGYATSRLGEHVTDEQLAQLIGDPNQGTTLGDMKAFAEGLGLYCRAVKTDIQTLKMLGGCQVILHMPGKKHFVVLGAIGNDSVWTIDLTGNTFLCRTDLSFFGLDWTEGTALVISDEPVDLPGDYTELDESRLESIVGGEGYSCTRVLQLQYWVYCIMGPTGCEDWYEFHPKRLGCQAAASGTCPEYWLERYREAPCVDSPYYPGEMCEIGTWDLYYMRACK
ncbi:MAG: hypothetical protein JXN61_06785 [Sedimentisphaerales bacterium]|nr:hypothetical protein [Sedimentisphaerales bacterium]